MTTSIRNYIPVRAVLLIALAAGCSKKSSPAPDPTPPPPVFFTVQSVTMDNKPTTSTNYNASTLPVIRFSFLVPISTASAGNSVTLTSYGGAPVGCTFSFEKGDSTLVVQPSSKLANLTGYTLSLSTNLQS